MVQSRVILSSLLIRARAPAAAVSSTSLKSSSAASCLSRMEPSRAVAMRGLESAKRAGSSCYAQDEATALYRGWTPAAEGVDLFEIDAIAESVRRHLTEPCAV